MKSPTETKGPARQIANTTAMAQPLSRRTILKVCGATIAGMASWIYLGMGRGTSAPLIITEQAHGLVVADPTRCLACRRCELACTDYNDGKSSPTVARIKVWRNLNFGPSGLHGEQHGHGDCGTGMIFQDFCKQCPHPVPCADICPNGAIEAKPPTNARVIDPVKCTGCRACLKACPWEMISYDADKAKATKCFLCDGKPKCVEACPAGALTYVPWIDLTGKVPSRILTTLNKPLACGDCHQ